MLLDLTLALPPPAPSPFGTAGEAASHEGGGDPFAALLAALSQPVAVSSAPTPARDGQASAPPMPDLLLRLPGGEIMVGPAPPLQLEPGAPVAIESGSLAATPPGAPALAPVADGVVAPPAASPAPSGPTAGLRDVAAGAALQAAVSRPALAPGATGARPQSAAITLDPASPPPRPEAAAAAVPLIRQDGGGGPPAEVRLDPLAAAPKPAPPPGAGGASTEARPPALQIALQIVHAAPHRIEQMRVRLHPAALGQVEIRLEFGEQGRLRALIAVERLETLEALPRAAQALERSLQDAGLRTDPGTLSFSLRRERDPSGQGGARAGSAARAAGAGSGDDDPGPAAWRSGSHLIDVHV
jgi:flagellar hook-length control protein FliK